MAVGERFLTLPEIIAKFPPQSESYQYVSGSEPVREGRVVIGDNVTRVTAQTLISRDLENKIIFRVPGSDEVVDTTTTFEPKQKSTGDGSQTAEE